MAGFRDAPHAELAGLLEPLPVPAFLVGTSAAPLYANAAARSLLESDPAGTRALLLAGIKGRNPSAVRAARLSLRCWMVVVQNRQDPAPLVAAARARWGLTPRQADVLRLVGRGLSNRAVGQTLGCAESTVELHVTALFQKAQCESRAALVAKLWSGA